MRRRTRIDFALIRAGRDVAAVAVTHDGRTTVHGAPSQLVADLREATGLAWQPDGTGGALVTRGGLLYVVVGADPMRLETHSEEYRQRLDVRAVRSVAEVAALIR